MSELSRFGSYDWQLVFVSVQIAHDGAHIVGSLARVSNGGKRKIAGSAGADLIATTLQRGGKERGERMREAQQRGFLLSTAGPALL
jgi:hypothetical protein